MAYLTLYREWRPRSFDEVVGQRHVTQTLTNALSTGRLAHAYLFCGPRGTGKTSVARILAKAVNCERGVGPEPCQECGMCVAITQGSSLDVFEIDAASNRGIDEIRDLREKARFAPAEGRYKVYIIDEVHMLSNEAFNALLKTLEEPPPHVLFILATTEAHKVPQTIASRCQRFDFHRLSVRDIAARLDLVAQKNEIKLSPEARDYIARRADGALRDALGLLDQSISYAGNGVELAHVLEVVGGTREDVFFRLTEAVGVGNHSAILEAVAEQVSAGTDLRQFYREYLGHWRDIMLARVCRDPAALVDLPPASVEQLVRVARGFSVEQISAVLAHLASKESDMRWTSQPRLLLELALLELAGPGGEEVAAAPPPALVQPAVPAAATPPAAAPPTAAAAPPAVAAGPPVVVPAAIAAVATAPTPAPVGVPPATPKRTATSTSSPSPVTDERLLETVWDRWEQVLKYIRSRNPVTHAMLREGNPLAVRGAHVVIGFRPGYEFHRDRCDAEASKALITTALCEYLGRDCLVAFDISAEAGRAKPPSRGGKTAAPRASSSGQGGPPSGRGGASAGAGGDPGSAGGSPGGGAPSSPPAGEPGGAGGGGLLEMAQMFGGEIVEAEKDIADEDEDEDEGKGVGSR